MVGAFGVALGLLCLMYIFDVSYWTGKVARVMKTVCFTIVGILMCIGCVLAGKQAPGAPVALYVLLFPAWVALIRHLFYRNLDIAKYLYATGISLLIISAATAGVWIAYVVDPADPHYWDEETKAEFNKLAGCSPAVIAADSCLGSLILWISPFLGACNSFVFGIFALILAHSVKQRDTKVTVALKMFLALCLLAAVLLWVAASIAGAGMRVSNAVQLFVAVFVAIMCGAVVATVGWSELQSEMLKIPLVQTMFRSVLSDWTKALFLIAVTPLLPLYVLLSAINSLARRSTGTLGYRITDEEERRLWLTLRTSRQLAAMRNWRWTQVLMKVMYIGLLYVLLNVGVTKLVTLFLSWLNSVLADLPYGLVIAIFFVVGLLMFLAPPVPGIPVYLAGGVILGAKGMREFGTAPTYEDGFWPAAAVAALVSWAIKHSAIFMQQAGIGENLAGSVRVRKLVNVNSVSMRAVKRILAQPGIRVSKVAILLGGPDWPTSVITGILRLSRLQMQIGSLPILFLVAPTSMAGSMMLRANDGGIWPSVQSVTLAVAALVQLIALMSAMYFITDVADKHAEELAAEPADEEVLALEEAEKRKLEVYLARTDWSLADISPLVRAVHVVGAAAMALCIYLLAGFAEYAFKDFAVTDSVEDDLDGNILNIIIAPTGYVALALVALGTLCLLLARHWAARRLSSTPPDFTVGQKYVDAVENPSVAEAAENAPLDDPVLEREKHLVHPDVSDEEREREREAEVEKERERERVDDDGDVEMGG